MAWLPIAQTVPQYHVNGSPASGYVLKFYAAGTATNIVLATDGTGATTATDVPLNASGYPEISGTVIIPHLDQSYKIALYSSQTAADADTGAVWTVDNITPPVTSVNAVDEKVMVSANDTTADTLDSKIAAGTNITVVETNDGANESLTLNLAISEHALPTADASYDLGSAAYQFKDVYLSGLLSVGTGFAGGGFLDEDDFASNSATKAASQQSIKAYVDNKIAGLNTKIIDIGDWDMVTNQLLTVPHGLTLSKIRNIDILIRNDVDSEYHDFAKDYISATSSSYVYAGPVDIVALRSNGGIFDNANYDSTSYNRGWIIIQYID